MNKNIFNDVDIHICDYQSVKNRGVVVNKYNLSFKDASNSVYTSHYFLSIIVLLSESVHCVFFVCT